MSIDRMPDHSAECDAARASAKKRWQPVPDETPDWPEMNRLTPEQQHAVLACPHWSHTSARFMYGDKR